MSYWNYRVLRTPTSEGELAYGIHEVYYDEEGTITNWSDSMTPQSDTLEGLADDLNLMMQAFEKDLLTLS